MILGDFQFSLKTMTPNSITRTTEFNWPDADRIGDIPNLQNLGMSSDKIEIEGVFYPKLNAGTQYNSIEKLIGDTVTKQVKSAAANFFGFGLEDSFPGYNSLNDLRNSKLCKIASNLINDNGEILGKFVIMSVKETQSYFDKNGDAQKIEFSLVLKRSPREATGAAAITGGSSFVDTVTNLARSYLRW